LERLCRREDIQFGIKTETLKSVNKARHLHRSNLLGHYLLYVTTLVGYLATRFALGITLGGERRDRLLLKYEIYNLTDFYLCTLRLFGAKDRVLPPALVADLYHDERNVRDFIRSRAKGELFVDVGAGIGLYTFELRTNFKRVLAIEPSPNNIAILMEEIRRQKADNIVCMEAAVSNNEGTSPLYLGPNWGWHSLIPRYDRRISVKTVTISKLLENEKVVDFIKVDVEGAEWNVLEGSIPILNRVKSWLVELHNHDKKAEITEWFVSRGYKVRWLDHSHIYAKIV